MIDNELQSVPFGPVGRIVAGYIRESAEDTERELADQKAGQRDDVVRLAGKDGHGPETIVWYDDWGRSGSEYAKRPEQERLRKDVRAGKVEVIYARSLDRISRAGAAWTMAFLGDCEANGTRIVTQREGEVSKSELDRNPSKWIGFATLAMVAEYESRVGRARAQAGIASKRRQIEAGTLDRIGRAPYGEAPGDDLPAVLAAWDATHNFLRAAKVLTAQGIRPRLGAKEWDGTSVARIIRRHRKDVPPQGARGRGAAVIGTRLFSRLLVCSCGTVMTSMPTAWGDGVNYYCRTAHLNADHPRPYVIAQRKVRAWAEERLAEYTVLAAAREPKATDYDAEAKRAVLRGKRERIVDMYADGTIDKAARDDRLAVIDRQLDEVRSLDTMLSLMNPGGLASTPLVDWGGDPAVANAMLRAIWRKVQMVHRRRGGKWVLEVGAEEWQKGAREFIEGSGDALPF